MVPEVSDERKDCASGSRTDDWSSWGLRQEVRGSAGAARMGPGSLGGPWSASWWLRHRLGA